MFLKRTGFKLNFFQTILSHLYQIINLKLIDVRNLVISSFVDMILICKIKNRKFDDYTIIN